MKDIEVSVIIPTYNRKNILVETLGRISKQTFPKDKYEVIVIDDCSKDGTEDFLKNYKSKTRFSFLINRPNLGRAGTRNRGITKASGKYILMLDDDIWAEEKLVEKHYVEHLRHTEASGVVGAILAAQEIPRSAVNQYLSDHHKWCYGKMSNYSDSLPFSFCKTASLSLKKGTILEVGLFDESYMKYGSEDTEFGYRLAKNGIKLYFAREAIGYHYHKETVGSLATKSISLGETGAHFLRQHPDAASDEYNGFFIPRFHAGFAFRAIFYNIIKLMLFNGPARQFNKALIKMLNFHTEGMVEKYLLPVMQMQYKQYGMRRSDI